MKIKLKLLGFAIIPAMLIYSGCSKAPEKAPLQQKENTAALPDYMKEDISKDYETIKKSPEETEETTDSQTEDTNSNENENNTTDSSSDNNGNTTDESTDIVPSHLKNSGVMEDIAGSKSNDVIEIKENLFISQINDIFFNFEDYEGKTIVVEGIYSTFESAVSKLTAPVVYRNGPGCCSNDAWAGFILRYDGELPKLNDWIRVTGTPVIEKTKEGYTNLYLQVSKLEVLDTRGAEYVSQ